ncbi:hypothetical protein IFM89_017851 [Coptis chinensis]|uniref:Uncharacterized protein n=1 Tax=Coptis chinensis TaxID=261450 RepID=A0A835I4V8_9MAGN|nr:hypothetical protein IFM89_017851 [Coptis chinensis]
MASALLASRAEPLWGERKVYARKQPNTQTPNPNPNFDYHQQIDEIESVSISSDSSAAAAQNHHSKESVHDGLVTFNIAAYTKGN